MAKKKVKRYRVLKPVRSDKKEKYWAAGEIITSRDFLATVIAGWLNSDPPVLEEVIQDGSDGEREG